MELNPVMPYVIGVFSGLLFAVIAWRTRCAISLWGIGGAIFGLTLATIVFGVGHAVSVPYSDEVTGKYNRISAVVSVVFIALVAAAVLFALKRSKLPEPAAPAVKQEAKPKA